MIKIKHIPCAIITLKPIKPGMAWGARDAKNKIMTAKCAQTNLSKSVCESGSPGTVQGWRYAQSLSMHAAICARVIINNGKTRGLLYHHRISWGNGIGKIFSSFFPFTFYILMFGFVAVN